MVIFVQKKIISLPIAESVSGFIPVTLVGSLIDWPVNIYWDGVRYGDDILGDVVIRNGNSLQLPGKMEGDRVEVEYWVNGGTVSAPSSSGSSTTTGANYGCCDAIRFIISNWLREATLSTNIAPATDVNNLKTEWRTRILRQTDLSEPLVICGTLPFAKLFSGFGITGHTISALGTVQIELMSGDDCETATVIYDSGELTPALITPQGEFIWGVDPWGLAADDGIDPVFSHFHSEFHANVFRITISDPNNPAGFFDVSQIFIGDTLQLDNNFSYGLSIAWKNSQQLSRTEGGSLLTVGSNQMWRELSLPFEFMTERDRQVMAQQQRMSPGQSVFMSAFPSGSDNEQREFAMACKFESPTFTKSHYKNWQSTITFLET